MIGSAIDDQLFYETCRINYLLLFDLVVECTAAGAANRGAKPNFPVAPRENVGHTGTRSTGAFRGARPLGSAIDALFARSGEGVGETRQRE